jgi:hypothetical protein
MSYLFGYIKQLLAGYEFSDREAFLEIVGHSPEGIEEFPLIGFFSLGWRDLIDLLQPMESTSSKEQFDVKSFY